MRKKFYFVAGEQVITRIGISVLDAWLSLTIFSRKHPVASEFRRLPITAVDSEGNEIAAKTWEQWQDALMRDTYGDGWREITDNSSKLL